jgi:amino acid permease
MAHANAWRSPFSILSGAGAAARRRDIDIDADVTNDAVNRYPSSSSSSSSPALPPRDAFPPPVVRDDGVDDDVGGGGGIGEREDAEYDDYDYDEYDDKWLPHELMPHDPHDYDQDDANRPSDSACGEEEEEEEYDDDVDRVRPLRGGRHVITPRLLTRIRIRRRRRRRRPYEMAITGTTFNFANSIIGAGAMGLGGAFASSGGLISILALCGFAYLTKLSLDVIVDLSSDRHRFEANDVVGGGDESGRISNDDICMNDDGDDSSDVDGIARRDGRYVSTTPPEGGGDGISGNVEDGNDDERLLTNLNFPGEDGERCYAQEVEADSSPPMAREVEADSSPLMAREEEEEEVGKDENEIVGRNALHINTPTKGMGLYVDRPLESSSALQRPNDGMNDRYDSPTMDVTRPSPFSPLRVDYVGDANGPQRPCTYEELGREAYGSTGRLAVLISKSLYAGGCLVAYVVVVRDNFGPAIRRMTMGPTGPNPPGDDGGGLYDDDLLAFFVSAIFMLPLSCKRTMKPLAKFSFVSILSIVFLILAVVYLYFSCTNPEGGGVDEASFYENWIEVRSFSGLVESLGCFVFTFVCHHTVNLAYESLPPPVRNTKTWRRVSTNSIALALQASLAIGVFSYLTFGSTTPADVVSQSRVRLRIDFIATKSHLFSIHIQLMGYPADITLANIARLLLCLNMILTFPLPFLTCREMTILMLVDMHKFYHRSGLGRSSACRTMRKCAASALFSAWRCAICKGSPRRQIVDIQGDLDDPDAPGEFVQMKRRSFFERWRRKSDGIDDLGADGELWDDINGEGGLLTRALLGGDRETDFIASIGGQKGKEINPSPLSSRSGDASSSESTVSSTSFVPPPSWIIPNSDGRQLTFLCHAALTFAIWLIVTVLAIKSPSLIDVLDLVGAFTGTMLAFILPALFSFKLNGYSHTSLAILVIGGAVGLLGTSFSLVKFLRDTVD